VLTLGDGRPRRAVVRLQAIGANAAARIPSSTLPGTYFVLASADDTVLVAESSEANNCRTSNTAVVVTP
jgi:hypothetical protein